MRSSWQLWAERKWLAAGVHLVSQQNGDRPLSSGDLRHWNEENLVHCDNGLPSERMEAAGWRIWLCSCNSPNMYRKAITFYDLVTERQWRMADWPVADNSLATFTWVPTNNLHIIRVWHKRPMPGVHVLRSRNSATAACLCGWRGTSSESRMGASVWTRFTFFFRCSLKKK